MHEITLQRLAKLGLILELVLAGCGGGNDGPGMGTVPPVGGAGGRAGAAGGGGAGGSSGGGVFQHPGVLVSKAQLDFVKDKVAAGTQPWKMAFDRAQNSGSGSPSYVPHPVANVVCGSNSNPDIGCTAEKSDMAAAYTHALLWYLGGDENHAKKAIEIMNAWSAVLEEHTMSNAPLQSGWVGSVFPRAAEIIRHTYSGWPANEVERFATMLRSVYLPVVLQGSPNNGNWELTMAEAAAAISVFLDDKASFDQAVSLWRKRVPAYIYLQSDGPTPVAPDGQPGLDLATFWYGQTTFEADGVGQETCRDLGHMQYGLAAIVNLAETALIQGVDLYGMESKRISAGLEFHAQFLDSVAAPPWLCGGQLNLLTYPTWEIGLNHYGNRMGMSLPHTRNLVMRRRPTGVDHHMEWETLTHADVGMLGGQ
jgi:hypothetical protein